MSGSHSFVIALLLVHLSGIFFIKIGIHIQIALSIRVTIHIDTNFTTAIAMAISTIRIRISMSSIVCLVGYMLLDNILSLLLLGSIFGFYRF